MKTLIAALLFATLALGCDESKNDKGAAPTASASAPPVASAVPSAPPPAPPPPPVVMIKKKLATECKPHPATVDFSDQPDLEREVRRKLGKETGGITPADLAQIKSINLANNVKVHQIDPCIFPMFTSLKDLFLGSGEYDDLTPIQKLTTLESLRISFSVVKDLHPIEGLKRMDRLDISHTLVGDDEFKSVASFVNLTELMLDETQIGDLTPVANLRKLERISIKKTSVKSLAPLAGIKTLKFVYIADTPVTDITPVQPLISNGMKLITN
jgi:internalin A